MSAAAKGRAAPRPDVLWPVFAFGVYVGPTTPWFAWRPVRLWDGRWTWLRHVYRRRVAKRCALPGPHWEFWAYSDLVRQ